MGMNLKEQVFYQAMLSLSRVQFMEWHARVLSELTTHPTPIKSLSRKTGLYMYYIHSLAVDLVEMGLIEYTREGLQLTNEWNMLLRLVDCCEERETKPFDYDAAYDVVLPKVVAYRK